MERVVHMPCGNTEEAAPIVRSVACKSVVPSQVEEVGFRLTCADIAMMVLFHDPKFPGVVVVLKDFDVDFMDGALISK